MAKEYKEGDKYYLPVVVDEILYEGKYPVKLTFLDGGGGDSVSITDEPNLLLTATEIAENLLGRRCGECLPMYDELKARNAELEALLKEVTATRDEAIRQNNELIAENDKLKAENDEWQKTARCYSENAYSDLELTRKLRAENNKLKSDCNDWKKTANERLSAMQMLSTERNKLMGSNSELKEWYDEANKTASEAAEANDELKAKVAELRDENEKLKAELDQRNKDFWAMKKDRDELDCIGGELRAQNEKLKAERDDLKSQVGKYTADIQDMAAEIHFHKEFGEGLDKQQKELQARYDELDSVNKEQAEKIRKLDAHNTYLKGLLCAKKKMRIVLNNGNMYDVEVGNNVNTTFDMGNELFSVKTEGSTVASFCIGKEPGNIAGWYMV